MFHIERPHPLIELYKERGFKWLDWGGGAGVSKKDYGLTEHKKGWSTDLKSTYFCGRRLNWDRYDEIVKEEQVEGIDFFPAYRVGEFD